MITIYSDKVLRNTSKLNTIDIEPLARGDKAIKKEINRVFQMANRRIQNVTKAGLASPAVKAVIAERGEQKYTYFTMKKLNVENDEDWEYVKYEYGRALAFLHNPTSSATGAREYIKYQQSKIKNATFETANKIVDLATDPTIDAYGNVNIFAYNELLEDYRGDVMRVMGYLDENADDYSEQLEKKLEEVSKDIASRNAHTSYLDRFF